MNREARSRWHALPRPWRALPRPWRALVWALLALAVLVGLGEAWGWPWLARPLARQLSAQLDRPVSLGEGAGLRLGLLGGVRVDAERLTIGGPAWRAETPTLDARGVRLRLRYADLLGWWRDAGAQGLRVRALTAESLAGDVHRGKDGKASWHMAAPGAAEGAGRPPLLLRFDTLAVRAATVHIDDAPTRLVARVDAALGPVPAASLPHGAGAAAVGVIATAQGKLDGKLLRAELATGSPLPWIGAAAGAPVPARLRLQAGRAQLDFEGRVRDVLGGEGLAGRFRLSGPSLAAIGDPLGVTLPSTGRFTAGGTLAHEGGVWRVDAPQLDVGASRLHTRLTYAPQAPGRARPLLQGDVGGHLLVLADLAPTIGGANADTPPPPGGKLLPRTPLDLPSLRAMDAEVAVAIDRLDLGGLFREPVAPLRAQLALKDGVLRLGGLDARAAGGRLGGEITLDGRAPSARLAARLTASGVDLARWLAQPREAGLPPYVSGRLGATLALQGQGRSTAELLGGASGEARLVLPRGRVSHLALEAAGLDVAQALGVMLRGDRALPLQCAVADLDVRRGVVTPKLAVVDTSDSLMWLDGSLSLRDETLALRLQSAPKDVSPLALRTPIHIEGTLAKPALRLDKGPLLARLVPAAVLGLVAAPLAALLPLIDVGDEEARAEMGAACRALMPAGAAPASGAARPAARPAS